MERKVGQKLMRKQMGKGSVFKRNAPGRDGLRPGVAECAALEPGVRGVRLPVSSFARSWAPAPRASSWDKASGGAGFEDTEGSDRTGHRKGQGSGRGDAGTPPLRGALNTEPSTAKRWHSRCRECGAPSTRPALHLEVPTSSGRRQRGKGGG